eukprot:CAMPEP_0202392586 /NCGR_PEP_ID=MMETSP1127-20130417/92456_1 /ASSEMBLY_ACC=CAM_ASM_000462 /TAXON_ID=3047 /ORGANISM="Dunaliella tertiolecta, Strain CCMP1320" /LENGTH=69 /DNA_ID=CAMNT_0048995111 /DNA_START=2114 /DNA_END=2323 /DNA_ORIENTATION=+
MTITFAATAVSTAAGVAKADITFATAAVAMAVGVAEADITFATAAQQHEGQAKAKVSTPWCPGAACLVG